MKISNVDFLCRLRECVVWIIAFFIRKVTLELKVTRTAQLVSLYEEIQ